MKKIFLGGSDISVYFLEYLKKKDYFFDLIITGKDKIYGRKKELKPTPVKEWALKNNIDFLIWEEINEKNINDLKKYDFFFVFSFNKILPENFINLPKFKTLNLHPSLLPRYRGPSPIISAILDDQKETGISLIILDEKMDHGPILSSQKIKIKEWKKNADMELLFAQKGAELFLESINKYLEGQIKAKEQNHQLATYCKKFFKKDMELFPPLNQRENFLKYCAFNKPFYFKNGKRMVVTKGEWKNNEFVIKKIIPEGKKEREWKKEDNI